jgi:hypothetical protein
VALAVGVAAHAGAEGGLVVATAALGVLLIAGAVILGRSPLVTWGLLGLAAAYAVTLAGEAGVDGASPLVATGLLLVAELGYWSVELSATAREEAAVAVRRLVALAALAAAALFLATFVLAATAVPLSSSTIWNAVGILAAAAVLGLIARLARSQDDSARNPEEA